MICKYIQRFYRFLGIGDLLNFILGVGHLYPALGGGREVREIKNICKPA